MKVYSKIFFAFLLFISCATYVDELSSIQTSIVTVAPNSGSNTLVLGSNSYPLTFDNAFTATPTVVTALCQFSSPIVTKYATQLSKQSITTSGFTLGITTGSNWNYLSYNIFASIVDSVIVGNYQFTDLGLKQDNTATIKTKSLSTYPLSNKFQTSFKVDIFIMGFDLTVSDASSPFFLNATFNYGSNDKTKGSYLKYKDYIYTQTSYPTFVSSGLISISLNWFGTLAALQLTYISHPFIVSPTAVYTFTGGYNTVSVTSAKHNLTLFDPNNNKNNLGSFNPASFYGFTSLNIKPTTTMDVNISILYGYFTNLTSSGSTINSLSASYFFYELFENSIVDHKFTQVIDAYMPEWAIGKINVGNTLTRQYYQYAVMPGSPNAVISTDIPVKIGSHYLMTIEILDQQGCYTGSIFTKESLFLGFTNYQSQMLNTSNTDAFFINPNQPCTSSGSIQFSSSIEKWYRYFQYQITATKSQNIQGFFTLSDQALNFYIKNIKFYQLSPNAVLDPMITEITQNSFFYYYQVTPTIQKGFFNELPSFASISNALMVYPYSGNPVTVKSISLSFTIGVTYTLSFYILDSAGNLASYFKSPVLLINFGGTTISTQTATLDKPFCNPAFNEAQILTNPVDKLYLQITLPIIPISTSNTLEFVLSDSSSSSHLYAIRSITLKNIEYFDPIARKNVLSCPQNTYLTTNTLPPACQACYIQNKIDNGSQCICPSNNFQNSIGICIQCSYSCYNCSTLNSCTSCPKGRIFDATLFMCNCTNGFYDDGMNIACAKCDQTCGSCSKNAYNCTSCPIGSVLDTTTSVCICGAGYFNDTTTRCGKCSNKCGNCSGNANKCTSCLNESGSTFDSATSTCKCQNGYSFSTSGICTKNHPIYIPNFSAQQFLKTFILKAYLTAINNSTLNATDIFKFVVCFLFYNPSNRRLDSQNVTLNVIQVILLPNNIVQFIVQNPSFDITNATVLLNINNPNINQTSIQFAISQLYSAQTMSSISSSTPSSVASTVLLTILLFIMLIFYLLGYKHNHTISFIQKISFLRFNLPITSSTFAFLYSLKYSYYAYGVNALQSLLSSTYLQNSNGNFYFVDQDANILRNVGIPILLSITIILLRLIGLLLFKSSQQTTSSKRYYYRAIEYVQKTIMFPIIFFGIAEMTFANLYKKSDTADPSIYNPSLAFSVIYVIYFAILTIATGFSKQISNYAKLELAGEYLFSIFDSIIIIQTYYTNNVLALIITIVIKCIYELFLKYTYATISKLDLMKVIVTVFQIALIGILTNSSTSLSSIQALFVIVVVIDLLYVLGTTILKAMDKKKIQEELESNQKIVAEKIPMDSTNVINP